MPAKTLTAWLEMLLRAQQSSVDRVKHLIE
jgi:hypothetical protein